MVIVARIFDLCIHNIVCAYIRIIIRYVKHPVLAERISPAVLTDKCAVSLEIHIKILLGITVVPADNHNVVIRLLRTDIAVGICLLIVIRRL